MYNLNDLIAAGTSISDIQLAGPLNDDGVTLSGDPISDNGNIAAVGMANGVEHALLLTPVNVPEPCSACF